MNKKIIHNIRNYLQQIISNAESINQENDKEISNNIKEASYRIEALLTDGIAKEDVILNKSNFVELDLKKFIGINVLIVDDIVENIYIMENIFKTLSCNILSATSGEEALKIYEEGFHPQIICMDMMMPGIDGIETTTKLKSLGCEAYFIAISALKNQSHDMISIFECWLSKPFTTEQIKAALLGYQVFKKPIPIQTTYTFIDDISKDIKEEILSLAKNGAYTKLLNLISELDESESKDFLLKLLHEMNFKSIIKSILSS